MAMYDVFMLVFSVFSAIIGFYIKRFYDKMDKLEERLNKLQIDDAANMCTKVELKDLKQDIKDFFTSIKEQLNIIEHHLRQPQK